MYLNWCESEWITNINIWLFGLFEFEEKLNESDLGLDSTTIRSE
jgi:hypothetical protein